MSLQGIFSREGLPATAIAQVWLLPTVGFAMPLKIMLPIEGERAEIAREWTGGRRWILW